MGKKNSSLASLSEASLRRLLIRLFKAMHFNDVVEYHGGPREQGKDIIMWKAGDLGERINYAVVVKRGNISGSAAKKGGAGQAATQVQQCFGDTFSDKLTSEARGVHSVWVIASGRISKDALATFKNVLKTTNCLNSTRFVDGDALTDLIHRHLPGDTLQTKIEDARETARQIDDNYSISFGISPDRTTFNITPKEPSAEPPTIDFAVRFPMDESGEKARKEFDEFLKSGGPLRLPKDYIVEAKFSDILNKLLGDPGQRLSGFEFIPEVGPIVRFRFKARTKTGFISQMESIELRCIRAGTDEVLATNEQQVYPTIVQLLFSQKNKQLKVQFRSRCSGHNVKAVNEWLQFQAALSEPHSLTIEHIETGIDIARCESSAVLSAVHPVALEMAETLAFIQSEAGVVFVWPESITADEQEEIVRVERILKTGRIPLESITVSVTPSMKFPTDGSKLTGHLKSQNSAESIPILGIPVHVGPGGIDCTDAEITLIDSEQSTNPTEEPRALVKAGPNGRLEMVFPNWPKSENV